MARPIEFDRKAARDRAMRLFWSHGYQGAGLTDLLETMEISRSSFYAAFGDKRRLFLECLDHFADNTVARLKGPSGSGEPLRVLERFFEQDALPIQGEERTWGCMLVNTVVEMAEVDEGLRSHAAQRLIDVEEAFQSLLIKAGWTADAAPDYAAFLMLLNEGLRVSSRQGMPLAAQKRQVALIFDMLKSSLPQTPTLEARAQ